MKRIFLLTVVPALLVAMGFAQTPAASGNSDQINIKGCLGGSDGNYTVAEDNTGKMFKITTSSTDLKAYVGQEVKLSGSKATAENNLTVTAVNMISEHCTAAAAAAAPSVSATPETLSTPVVSGDATPAVVGPTASAGAPSETVSTPPAAAATPAAIAPDATVSAPVAAAAPTAAAPDATASAPSIVAAPAAAAPDATVSAPVETASAPAAAAPVHRTRHSARSREAESTPAAAAAPAETASAPAPVAAAPSARGDSPSEAANAPATPATSAAPAGAATTASTRGSTWMLVSIVVVVLIVIGGGVPLYNRWKKQRLLEQTKGQNLSFTKEAKSDPGKRDTTGGHKAA